MGQKPLVDDGEQQEEGEADEAIVPEASRASRGTCSEQA